MRSSKTPLSFDDDTNEILSHSLSLCCLSQKVFLIKRVFQTRGRRQQKENLSLSRGTLFRSLLSRNARRSVLVRARIFARSVMMIFSFFWGKNSRCGLKKTLETRGLLRSSRKKGLCENEWCDLFLSLSLSGKSARARRNARKNTRV